MKILATAAMMIAVAVGAALAEERILSFESDVVVMSDGVLDVTETIEVVAEGNQIRRGIFRDFPLTFIDDDGITRRVSFSIEEITRDGAPEPYHTASNANGIRIYIGEEDVFIPSGTYTYRIRYETGRQIRFRDTETELFWNVTGNDWAFPIDSVTARFALPDNRPPVQWTAFTGRYGARGDAFSGSVAADGQLTVTTTAPLAAREGLSVAIEIPPGLIAPEDGLAAAQRGDYATALKLLRPLAEQGHADAQHNLGVMYINGRGVPQDYAEAVKWFRLAAEQGHAVAQYNLGNHVR